MPSIDLIDASVEIPIYNARGRSLKSSLIRSVGGQVANDDSIVRILALRNINLQLRAGDRLAIVGHNGAGKSTLLRVLSGAYEPSAGIAEINGSVASLLDITMGMDPELTGAENVVLRGAFVGLSFAEARRRLPEIAEFSELGDYLDLPMRTYSSGMVLRLAFAVSTLARPDILLMDELISVGDAGFREKARARLNAMMHDASILVLASHANEELRAYCNKAILMKEGRILLSGSVDRVIEAYDADRHGHPIAET